MIFKVTRDFSNLRINHNLHNFFKVILCSYSTSRRSKIYESCHEAIKDIPNGAKLLVGKFIFSKLFSNSRLPYLKKNSFIYYTNRWIWNLWHP